MQIGINLDSEEEVVDAVERLIQERDSGLSLDLTELTPLEWELVVYWDSVVAFYKRQHEAKVSALFEALVSLRS